MFNSILVATDGSEHAQGAIEQACQLALRYDAKVYFLHVLHDMKIPDGIYEYIKIEKVEDTPEAVFLKKIGDGILKAAKEKAQSMGVRNFETAIAEGEPATEILKFAKDHDVDTIFLGSRGLGSLKGLMLGSVSNKVCHMAECTCVTVK